MISIDAIAAFEAKGLQLAGGAASDWGELLQRREHLVARYELAEGNEVHLVVDVYRPIGAV